MFWLTPSLSAALNESISSQSKFLEDFLQNSDKKDFTRKVAFLPLVNQLCLAKIAMSTFFFFLQKLNLNSRQTLHSPSTEFCSIFHKEFSNLMWKVLVVYAN